MRSVLVVVASANEGRCLAPVIGELTAAKVRLSVRHLSHLSNGDSETFLKSRGIEGKSIFETWDVVPFFAARRYSALLLANDNIVMNHQLLRAFARRGRVAVLVQEGVVSWGGSNSSASFGRGLRRGPALLGAAQRVGSALMGGDWRFLFSRVWSLVRGQANVGRRYGGSSAVSITAVATISDAERKANVKEGGGLVCVTGVPGLFDGLVASGNRSARTNRVLVVTSPIWRSGLMSRVEYDRLVSRTLASVVGSGLEHRIRLHPSESPDSAPRELAADLEWADVVLAPVASTVLLQAVASGCLVCLVDDRGESVYDAISSYVLKIESPEEVSSLVGEDATWIEATRRYDKFCDDWSTSLDGEAGARIAQLVVWAISAGDG